MAKTSVPTLLAAGGLVLTNRLLLRAGLRRRLDGWRRAAGLVLRGEESTFILSAFAVDVWSDQRARQARTLAETQSHVAQRLAAFLSAEPECHVGVRQTPVVDCAERLAGPTYTLAFQPEIGGPARFAPPLDWTGDRVAHATAPSDLRPLLNMVCRPTCDGLIDLWVRVNHVGADGVPIQEMLSRLEAAWGVSEDLRYPSHDAFAPLAVPRPLPGRAELSEVQSFIDFSTLLAWRKRASARLPQPMTVSAAMLWCLARHEAFSCLHVGTTVETAPTGHIARGVGVVVVRPSDYFDRPNGLPRFVADFNRQLDLTRRRASGACRTLDAAALISPTLAGSLLAHALANTPRAFGSVGLTMLKDARVFGAPIAEAGHSHGFIAVGSIALPTADGSRVGCVTIKGPTALVAKYPSIIQQAIARCDAPDSTSGV